MADDDTNRRLDLVLDALDAMIQSQRATNQIQRATNNRLDLLIDELAAFRGHYNAHTEHPPR